MKKCDLNTCSIRYSSMCVDYTGTLVEDSYITLADCNVNLNDFLNQVDILLKKILDNINPSILDVQNANCSLTEINTLLSNSSNLDGSNVINSKLIISLLKIICEQQAELTAIKTNMWDYDLPDSIIDNLSCFSGIINDPCGTPIKIKTFKDLLLIMIDRLCCVTPC